MKGAWGHLTYCLNVHPGETWQDVLAAVEGPALEVKRLLAPDEPFGLGLRLSATAVAEAVGSGCTEGFRRKLRELGMYVFTVNGFPYGRFHDTTVKDQVYLPDWSDLRRRKYTSQLAVFLAQLLPEGTRGSVSTVPLGYRRHGARGDLLDVERGLDVHQERLSVMADALVTQVVELAELERATSRWVQLALEPEPDCLLETSKDVVAFYETYLSTPDVAARVARDCRVARSEALGFIRRYLGVCIDTCHAAVEFEQPEDVIARLQRAGVSIAKLQLSSGLRLCPLSPEAVSALRAFDEPVYLHQVVARASGGDIVRMNDLKEAFERFSHTCDDEWRVHFHVPVHEAQFPSFSSTRDDLERWLQIHKRHPICDHLEVETYTWDVLPDKRGSLVQSLCQELQWVRGQLSQ